MKTFTSMHLILLLIHTALIQNSLAKWRSTNPGGGGAFNSPVITSDGNWVVASDLGGLHISRNRGKSWYPVGSERGLTETHISSLTALPSGALVIGTEAGLYVGDSAGKSVRRVYPTRASEGAGYVAAVAPARAENSLVFAALHQSYDRLGAAILRSDDSATSWTQVAFLPDVRALAFRTHPKSPHVLWLVTGEGRFTSSPARAFRSLDGGATWRMNGPLRNADVIDIDYALDERQPSKMYLTLKKAGKPVFWTSLDNGDQWKSTASVSKGPTPGVIVLNSRKPNYVQVIDVKHSILWRSKSAGKNWVSRELSVTGGWSRSDEDWGMGASYQGFLHTIGYDPDSPSVLLWTNNQFVYKSTSAGARWADTTSRKVTNGYWISRGIDNVVPYVIELSLADPELVYVGFADLGLWRSTDAGASWKSLNTPEFTGDWAGKGGNTLTVVADPTRKNVVWANLGGNIENRSATLLKSTNRGDTWTPINSGLPSPKRYIESLVVAPDSDEDWRWLFVIVDGDVYLSKNDGNSWELTLKCSDCVRVAYTDKNGVIAAGPSGVFRNWNGGVFGEWTDITSSLPLQARTGWTEGQHWMPQPWAYVGPTMVASRSNQDLWLAIKGKGVYFSDNYAASWTLVLDNPYVRFVSVDPKSGHVLVASSSALTQGGFDPQSRGVLEHPSGKSISGWKSLNQGLAYPFALQVATAKNGQRWCISPGQGVMKWS